MIGRVAVARSASVGWRWLGDRAAGLGLTALLGVLALAAEIGAGAILGYPAVEALVTALLLGVVVRNAARLPPILLPGIQFAAKPVLELAVALLGAGIALSALVAAGAPLLLAIVVVVALALGAGLLLGRLLGLGPRLALLVSVGNAICGNSAIAAVAPVIGATRAEIASAIALTAVLGTGMVLLLPLSIPLVGLGEYQYGVLAGLTVYAVPQVLAAALPVGQMAGEVAALVKLTRVALLGPVVLVIGMVARRGGAAGGAGGGRLPWFVVGFLGLALLRGVGVLPEGLAGTVREASRLLTILAMAALGLGVDLAVVRRVGPRVMVAAAGCLLLLTLLGLLVTRLLLTGPAR
jgi:uncharacterized integral membrane protein (TIGR00698 family)